MSALAGDTLDRVFRTGRTFNHYTSEAVAERDLRAIWDLLRWGPTSANQEPLRIVWCVSDAARARLADCCSAANAPKIRSAPVSAVLGMDMEFYERLPQLFPHQDARAWFFRDGAPNTPLIAESAFRNSTLQGAYFIVAARMLGLDCGPMSGFDAEKVDAAFFAGTNVRVNFITTLGHGDRATLHDRLPRLDFDEANTIA